MENAACRLKQYPLEKAVIEYVEKGSCIAQERKRGLALTLAE